MNVTLRSEGDGVYAVHRGPDRWIHPPIVVAGFHTWEIRERRVAGPTRETFQLLSEARAWLNSDAGQLWLDGLPKETP